MFCDVPRLADAFGHQNVRDDGIELAHDISRKFRQCLVTSCDTTTKSFLDNLLAVRIEQTVGSD